MRRLRWRYRCWRVRHQVWRAYVAWWRDPCPRTLQTYNVWERYWEHMLIRRP